MRYSKLTSLVFLLFFLSCKSESAKTQSNSTTDGVVSVEEFSKLLNSDHQLIDVRTPGEVTDGYIPNAKNINFREDDFQSRITALDKSKPVLVYCKSGGRSGKTYKLLKDNGFNKVYDLKGGFTAWAKASKPISK